MHYVIRKHLKHLGLFVPHFSEYGLKVVHFECEPSDHSFHLTNLFFVGVCAVAARVTCVTQLVLCRHLYQIFLWRGSGWRHINCELILWHWRLLLVECKIVVDAVVLCGKTWLIIRLRAIESWSLLRFHCPLSLKLGGITPNIYCAILNPRGEKACLDQGCERGFLRSVHRC